MSTVLRGQQELNHHHEVNRYHVISQLDAIMA